MLRPKVDHILLNMDCSFLFRLMVVTYMQKIVCGWFIKLVLPRQSGCLKTVASARHYRSALCWNWITPKRACKQRTAMCIRFTYLLLFSLKKVCQ